MSASNNATVSPSPVQFTSPKSLLRPGMKATVWHEGGAEHDAIITEVGEQTITGKCKDGEVIRAGLSDVEVAIAELLKAEEIAPAPEPEPDASADTDDDWHEASTLSVRGCEYTKSMPSKAVPAIAKLGQVAHLPEVGEGVIIRIDPEYCTIRAKDGGEYTDRWGVVAIEHVLPPTSHTPAEPDHSSPEPQREHAAQDEEHDHHQYLAADLHVRKALVAMAAVASDRRYARRHDEIVEHLWEAQRACDEAVVNAAQPMVGRGAASDLRRVLLHTALPADPAAPAEVDPFIAAERAVAELAVALSSLPVPQGDEVEEHLVSRIGIDLVRETATQLAEFGNSYRYDKVTGERQWFPQFDPRLRHITPEFEGSPAWKVAEQGHSLTKAMRQIRALTGTLERIDKRERTKEIAEAIDRLSEMHGELADRWSLIQMEMKA